MLCSAFADEGHWAAPTVDGEVEEATLLACRLAGCSW